MKARKSHINLTASRPHARNFHITSLSLAYAKITHSGDSELNDSSAY